MSSLLSHIYFLAVSACRSACAAGCGLNYEVVTSGYPASVQRPDGKFVTIYYFHDKPQSDRYHRSNNLGP